MYVYMYCVPADGNRQINVKRANVFKLDTKTNDIILQIYNKDRFWGIKKMRAKQKDK